jgi:hypothetical protein
MKETLIRELESFLQQEDFGKNWDGAYQDVIPTIRKYFTTQGFETHVLSEWDSPSRDTELIARNEHVVVRIPWALDRNGLSLVHLHTIEVQGGENTRI